MFKKTLHDCNETTCLYLTKQCSLQIELAPLKKSLTRHPRKPRASMERGLEKKWEREKREEKEGEGREGKGRRETTPSCFPFLAPPLFFSSFFSLPVSFPSPSPLKLWGPRMRTTRTKQQTIIDFSRQRVHRNKQRA